MRALSIQVIKEELAPALSSRVISDLKDTSSLDSLIYSNPIAELNGDEPTLFDFFSSSEVYQARRFLRRSEEYDSNVFIGTNLKGDTVFLKECALDSEYDHCLKRELKAVSEINKLNRSGISKMMDNLELESRHLGVFEFISGGSLERSIGLEILTISIYQDNYSPENFPSLNDEAEILKNLSKDELIVLFVYLRQNNLSCVANVASILDKLQSVQLDVDKGGGLGIVHGDLSPDNIINNEKKEPVLVDFGSVMQPNTWHVNFGKIMYAPPEPFLNLNVSNKTDVFSLGSILYEITYGRHPFLVRDFYDWETYRTLSSGGLFQRRQSGNVLLDQITNASLDPNPKNRPTLSEVSRDTKIAVNQIYS